MLNSLRVLILDFDGVVVESNDIKTRAFERIFSRFPQYAEAAMAFHHANVSVSRFAKFDHLAELMGRGSDVALKLDLAAEFSKHVFDGMITVPLVPGAEAFLQMAKGRLPLYLASVTPEPELKMILDKRGLAHWFHDAYGCPPWTKPDAIRYVLGKNNFRPGDALLIGDSSGDQRTASETGVQFLARDSGLSFDDPKPLAFEDFYEISHHMKELFA